MKKLLGLTLVVAALAFSGCEKCVKCELSQTCHKCTYDFLGVVIENDTCGLTALGVSTFTSNCSLRNGTVTDSIGVIDIDEYCTTNKGERDSFKSSRSSDGYSCSEK